MFVRLLATLPGARSLELLQVSCALRFSTQTWSISNEIVYQSEDHFYFLALFFFSFSSLDGHALFCTIARNHCFRASQRGRSLAILCCTKCCSMHAPKWSANSSEGKLLTNFPIISIHAFHFRMTASADGATIIYTKTDEAPALATYSFLPIVEVRT